MASGSISLTSNKAWGGVIYWSAVQNIAGNYSDVTVIASMWKTDGYLTSGNSPTSGTITINGVSYNLISYQEFKDEVCIFEGTVRVDHDSDGSKSIDISLTCYGQSGTSLAGAVLSGSGTAELDTIPRSSTLSCDEGVLGNTLALKITRESSSFTHTITYQCGDVSGTVCTKTTATSVSWKPPLSLASQAPAGTAVTITFTLTAYSGNTALGTDTLAVKCAIPDSVVPTLSVEVSDVGGYLDTYGAYVQSKSTVLSKITAAGIYGSTIGSYQVTFDEKTYLGKEVTTDAIKGSGTLQLVATVKDSRGRTASVSVDIPVLAYESPNVSRFSVQRCNADGTRNASGSYLAVVFDATVTALNNKNSAVYTLKYKKSTDSIYTSVTLNSLTRQYTVTGYEYRFSAAKSSSYNVILSIKDDFPAVEKSAVGPSEMTLWSTLKNGMGFAFGKVAELAGYLDMGFHIYMNGNRIHGLPAPVDDDDAATKAYADAAVLNAYPVGSVYITLSSLSPADLFGGTWERIKGRFLLSVGTPEENTDNDTFGAVSGKIWSVPLGSTGGQDFHQTTEEEMPSHTHSVYAPMLDTPMYPGTDWNYTPVLYTPNGNNNAIICAAGGNQPHNNMPPYLAVYMWKRVA